MTTERALQPKADTLANQVANLATDFPISLVANDLTNVANAVANMTTPLPTLAQFANRFQSVQCGLQI